MLAGAGLPRIVAAARLPSCCAASQCPVRAACRGRAGSPTARTAGFDVTCPVSTMMPRPVSSPAASASVVSGTMPRPSTTTSASSSSREDTPEWTVLMPCSACTPCSHAATSSPSTMDIGGHTGSASVTSHPRVRAVEATSAPIRPAPTTSTVAPGTSATRSRSASSAVRSTCTRGSSQPGIGGTRPARTNVPSDSSTAPAPGRSAVTVVRLTSRTDWSSYHPSGCSAMSLISLAPLRNSFDRGGRS